MLQVQVLFFAPLAVAIACFAYFSSSVRRGEIDGTYVAALVFAWLGAGSLLYIAMLIVTPNDGLLYFPVLLAAYAAPVLFIAATLRIAGQRWSRDRHVIFALVVSAVAAFFSPLLLLLAACIVQGNCL